MEKTDKIKFPARLENESHRAYSVFQLYGAIAPHARSVSKLVENYPDIKRGSADTWQSQFNWNQRLEAYDNAILKAATDEIRADRQKRLKDAISKSLSSKEKIREVLDELLERTIGVFDLEDAKELASAIRAFKTLSEVEKSIDEDLLKHAGFDKAQDLYEEIIRSADA